VEDAAKAAEAAIEEEGKAEDEEYLQRSSGFIRYLGGTLHVH
jgi:hypothetical protein